MTALPLPQKGASIPATLAGVSHRNNAVSAVSWSMPPSHGLPGAVMRSSGPAHVSERPGQRRPSSFRILVRVPWELRHPGAAAAVSKVPVVRAVPPAHTVTAALGPSLLSPSVSSIAAASGSGRPAPEARRPLACRQTPSPRPIVLLFGATGTGSARVSQCK